MNIKTALRTWRTTNDLSRPEAAEVLGVSPKSIEAYELGVRCPVPMALEGIQQRMHNYQGKRRAAKASSKRARQKKAVCPPKKKTK